MKKWWQEWAFFDAVALGVGITLIFIYVFADEQLQSISAFQSLVPNLATEIIGVWVSIRIIEKIIRNRDQFHGNRRNVFESLANLGELQRKMFPNPQEWQLRNLINQRDYCAEIIETRKKYLLKDEIEQSKKCLEIADDAYGKILRFFEVKKDVSETKVLIELKENAINRYREGVLYNIKNIVDLGLALSGDSAAPLGILLTNFRENAKAANDCFNDEENAVIAELLKFFDDKETITYSDITKIPSTIVLEITKKIWTYGADWYKQLSHAEDMIYRLSDSNDNSWASKLEIVGMILERNPDKYSKPLLDLAKLWLQQALDLGESATQVIAISDEYIDYLQELRSNIFNETPVA